MIDAQHDPSESQRRINVTFSPPTPNGDLHLGHLSGPVLASDVCARAQKMMGHDVAFVASTDDNQTYVVTTAERIGTTPEALIREALDNVRTSLDLAGIDLDVFERPDASYREYVRGFFTHLWKHGAFDRRVINMPFDHVSTEYKAEAFVTGRCPRCLAHARAGVCEECGLYNLPSALLPTTDGASVLPHKPVSIWVLDLERYRDLITNWYEASHVTLRPDLQRVVTDTLSERLPYIPVTYPINWGIAVDWDGPSSAPQAINAWPEIYVGHLYWLDQARSQRRRCCDELIQFIGIDNGFYNAFCYLTLALLAVEHGLPVEVPTTRTVTNQFLLLEGRKFSTSKGDVVWARDFLERVGRDRTRFILSLTSPELQQSEFSEQGTASTLEARFDRPLAAIEIWFNGQLRDRGIEAPISQWWAIALQASLSRFEASFTPETFSVRRAAQALSLHLDVLATRCVQVQTDDASDVAGALLFLWTLRTLAWPVTPDLAHQVALAFGAEERPGAPFLRDAARPPIEPFRGISFSASVTLSFCLR